MTQPIDSTKPTLPATDSIRELADFWDHHDLTDFEGELEEIPGPVFARPKADDGEAIAIPLQPDEAEALARLAASQGTSREELLRRWVLRALRDRSKAS